MEWVRDLGCNVLHILPFLDSPLVDKGFDISDYYRIRPDLGTMEDVQEVIDAANSHGIRVFMDLVFNHISDRHEWFRKAEEGDDRYRDYFLWQKERPKFLRRIDTPDGVFAEYDVEGEVKNIFIMFPELVGEIPHWHQGKDGYWYYHTFYPQQPDVNWLNPDVFMEFAKILMFWASKGFNFRLDAILFVGKGPYKDAMHDSAKTHAIIEALCSISHLINPECAFIVESYETLPSVINYYGRTNNVESQLSYNFHMCTHAWAAITQRDAGHVWKILDTSTAIPKHAEWINFLRNHDQLELRYIDGDLHDRMNQELLPHGLPFGEGHGIAGRTFSLIGADVPRYLMAYTLMASIPGGLGVIYGDETGKKNIPLESLQEFERADTRNINRGELREKQMRDKESMRIYMELAEILNRRKILREYQNAKPQRLTHIIHDVFAAKYVMGISELYVLVNLSDKPKQIPLSLVDAAPVLTVNQAEYDGHTVGLKAYSCIWIQR
jgi:maltose alpha-D-glucosyltransferase/alpha-amylase